MPEILIPEAKEYSGESELEICDLIKKAQIKILTERGYEPKHAYLGRVEMDEMLSWAQRTFGYEKKPRPEGGNEFLGLKLIPVDLDRHFYVA